MKWRILRSGAAAALLCFACSSVVAADGERILPANEEPRHVVKLENEWVRIIHVEYRIKLVSGATIGPLTIPGPSIRVAMGEGKMLHEIEDTQTEMRLAPAQFVFQPQTTTATFTNSGSTTNSLSRERSEGDRRVRPDR